MHTMIYYLAIRKDDVAICRDMNGLGKHYAKWNKPDRERQILYNMTYMWNLKKFSKLMNRTKKKLTHRYREKVVTSGETGGGRDNS